MIRLLVAVLLLAGLSCSASAQALYMPRDIQQAYAKGTRAPDGRPGPEYWQNRARYHITVQAQPPDRNIRGRERITYFNNSPDTLRRLVIRLVQNIHQPGATRSADASADYLTSGVEIDTVTVAGQKSALPYTGHATWRVLRLARPLLPHDSVQLTCAWHFPISLESGREGMIDKTTYFLAYFYPRVSVYDDYNGWDQLDFTDQQEFYNDFNDYTLHVQVPANYLVWATGTLQNPDEVLQKPFAKRLKQSLTSD
ncbi:MAG TPA: M1 family peptidase, partial [Hymenobacter sp.]